MVKQAIKTQSIVPRIDGIQKDIANLKKLGELSPEEFGIEDNFIKAQFYLRRALEGVFHIATHILSRIPGERATEYKSIALKMGDAGIVNKSFAENELKSMAGYRNRLTHFYADIMPEEIYRIIREDVDDCNTFLVAIKELLLNPDKYNLVVE